MLFNILRDLGENKNLYKSSGKSDKSIKKIVKKLEISLDKYLKKVKAPKWKPGITWKENKLETINSFY